MAGRQLQRCQRFLHSEKVSGWQNHIRCGFQGRTVDAENVDVKFLDENAFLFRISWLSLKNTKIPLETYRKQKSNIGL